jgi:phospholipid/cholesterol/gamma-HCH transport system substrate-binding protein
LVATAEGEVPIIRSKPSLSARLENVLTNVLANLDRTSNSVNAVLDADNRAAFKAMLADTAALTHALAAQQGALSAAIAGAARTTGNTARASEQLGPLIERIASSAAAVEKMADEAARASAAAGRAVDSVGAGARQLNSETLPELDRLLAELNVLAASMRRLSEQTERDPSSLLQGQRSLRPGPGEIAKEGIRP